MRKKLLTAALAVLLTSPVLAPTRALAQEDEVEGLSDAEMDAIAADELNAEEAPPKPEYPYPGATEEGFPKTTAQRPKATPPPPRDLPRPKKIDDEGTYHYGTELDPVTANPQPGTEVPKRTTEQGEFYYDTKEETPKFSGQKDREAPIQMNAQGQYFYPVEHSPMNGTASIRFGILSRPDLKNKDSGSITFEQIYGKSDVPVLLADYEWRMTSKVGRLGLKLTSGLAVSSGKGRFRKNPDQEAMEKFTFLMLPNQVTAVYRFQYAEEQLIVPFVEGGGGYFTFTEFRDDDKGPKFGGAPVTVAAGGVNILLDWLDRKSIRQLDNDYGINHVWLTAEYRAILGFGDFNFTSRVINAGFLMDF